MKLQTSYSRPAISFVVMMAIATVFSLSSFAAPDVKEAAGESIPAQDCPGTLTVAKGQVTINGNVAQTGATVLTGSVLATSSGAKAFVDLGALGRIELGDDTTLTVICSGNQLEVRSDCSRSEVEVRRGNLDVKSPKTETLTAGKKEHYDGAFDATSTGGVDFKFECEGRKRVAGGYFTPGLAGLLALIGLAAGVAIAIGIGDEDNAAPAANVSPVLP
jgi:hypothetical protein